MSNAYSRDSAAEIKDAAPYQHLDRAAKLAEALPAAGGEPIRVVLNRLAVIEELLWVIAKSGPGRT